MMTDRSLRPKSQKETRASLSRTLEFLAKGFILSAEMSKTSRFDENQEQERFADSVKEINERLAREREDENALLLQEREDSDFQGFPVERHSCLVFILFILFFPIGFLAKKKQRLIDDETRKYPKTLKNYKMAQIYSQELMEYCAGMIFATLCGHVTIWIILVYYVKCMARPDCPWK
ncbi:Oidioi.mRNA.OKI2018_I69.chr2.g5210.t1.cds [Oikopleura dioica]|uniref:Oidioi.mRNA.OKI2018_I69.chr2.g5210.t1.cds n=1 Tax=Oikopleura dioica TaxID=34765 RepID=A0ABN7SZ89_OIKDI|nr:Oidioi.mRNA.OKI2018_I69.chr2.g5210.t1.cds [Oikopleura dioica]